jgi:hypothetical protein
MCGKNETERSWPLSVLGLSYCECKGWAPAGQGGLGALRGKTSGIDVRTTVWAWRSGVMRVHTQWSHTMHGG